MLMDNPSLRLALYATISIGITSTPIVRAELYRIPNANPESYAEIQSVIDPENGEIIQNLNDAMCGGWDFNKELNGVFGREEPLCPPSAQQPIGATCIDQEDVTWKKINTDRWIDPAVHIFSDAEMDENAKRTIASAGLIANVKGVPGRANAQALGNPLSGLGLREEKEGLSDIVYDEELKYRVKTDTSSGFEYPDTTCGLATLCRTSGHPDRRTIPAIKLDKDTRDGPPFFCENACQRPLDTPGKPQNWDIENSDAVDCAKQEADDDGIKYSCGGGETKGPDQNFCQELTQQGPLGGLCEDMNAYIYTLWAKKEGVCVIGQDAAGKDITRDIYLYEKGDCGFAGELIEEKIAREAAGFENAGTYECCSDAPYNPVGFGESCIVCTGDDCRLNQNTHPVIINDAWVALAEEDGSPNISGAFPNNGMRPTDQPDQPTGEKCIDGTAHSPDHQRKDEGREYISFFREYPDASYERAPLRQSAVQPDGSQKELVKDDDNKKEHIPVACYGMYDQSPEDAKNVATEASDKRCVIATYYDDVNFWNMEETQKGKGFFSHILPDNPFNDPLRAFDKETSTWFPQLGSAFSMINDTVFSKIMNNNLTFTLLTPDHATQRATVQISASQPLSSGALLRAFDDTVTNDADPTKDRRSLTQWWQAVETEMHEFFSPPTIRLLLPSTWSVDLDPLDPIYTPPVPKKPSDEAVDPRSETIEVQIAAREDVLGDIIAYMERARLLRIEGEPIPVVVPIGNPTELRAIAHGWEVWAQKQEENEGPGVDKAKAVAAELLAYASRMDDVRKMRAQLPRYAGALLQQQTIISTELAQWLKDNVDAYEEYIAADKKRQEAEFWWKDIASIYHQTHDENAFPWCRNDRYTTPIYSLLDPWMPTGRSFSDPRALTPRDPTGGYAPYLDCMQEISTIDPEQCDSIDEEEMCFDTLAPSCTDAEIFDTYAGCVNFVDSRRKKDGAAAWPSMDVCNGYLPQPPLLPFLEAERNPDVVIDFTAFREPSQTIKLPILKPTQIRLDFSTIRPPALESTTEPIYPELPPLPEIPKEITDQILESLPKATVLKKASTLSLENSRGDDRTIPKIVVPKMDTTQIVSFLTKVRPIIMGMSDEYKKFWDSLTMQKCEGDNRENCVAPGTEQDCLDPYNDPNNRCVHFEGDLKERLQRIGARPAILLKDDFRSVGTFRDPMTHGQDNCETHDWVCQLLNARNTKPREGWQVNISDEYDPDALIQDIRRAIREQTDNMFDNPADTFPYDFPQDQMFEIFKVPEGERIERRIESIQSDPQNPDSPPRS